MSADPLCRWRRPVLAGLMAWILVAGGCTLNQVIFQRDAGVTRAFEGGVVLPDYDYYYSGPEAEPLAIVGIKSGYRFEPGLWKKAALTEAQLREWVWRIDTTTRGTRFHYYGSKIIAPDGAEVGIWYSFHDWVVAEVTPDRQVILHTPDNTVIPGLRRREKSFPDPP